MKRAMLFAVIMIVMAIAPLVVYADDVQIDSNGNVKTGVASSGNLEVTGASAEKAIVGQASGTGGAGVYGINSTSGSSGYLGWDTYGVFGYSPTGWAGYFWGDVSVNGNLIVSGTITGTFSETDPVFTASPSYGITSGMITNWNTAYGWGDHASAGYLTGELDPQVGTLTNGKWCTSDGSQVNCTSDVPADGYSLDAADGSPADAVYVDNSGNVGIGTTTPLYILHVKGAYNPRLLIEAAASNPEINFKGGSGTDWALYKESVSGDLRFYRGGDRLSIQQTGNVGIGTSTPGSRLTVAGTIESASGGIKFPDGTLQETSSAPLLIAQVPKTNIVSTVDSAADTGMYTSITIGADGLPVISYYDNSSGDLKAAKCGNVSCSSGNTSSTLDSSGDVGSATSITIGTDGLPVISYHDWTNHALKVAKCGNASCSSGNTITTVDSSGYVGPETSITLGTDGLPVIAYFYTTNGDLKVAKCGNASCSSGNTISTVDTAGLAGSYLSITVGTDGFPVIAYFTYPSAYLKVARCGNASCSSGNTTAIAVSEGWPRETSITIGTDGLPIISFYDNTSGNIKAAKCGNASCSSGNTISTVDSSGFVNHTSITIAMDGLPVISYYDYPNSALKIAKCGNMACSSGNTATMVDNAGDVGAWSAVTIGTDGLPVISYYDATNGDLKVAKCANQFCLNNWTRR